MGRFKLDHERLKKKLDQATEAKQEKPKQKVMTEEKALQVGRLVDKVNSKQRMRTFRQKKG